MTCTGKLTGKQKIIIINNNNNNKRRTTSKLGEIKERQDLRVNFFNVFLK